YVLLLCLSLLPYFLLFLPPPSSFFTTPAPLVLYTLSLHDALPICAANSSWSPSSPPGSTSAMSRSGSETSAQHAPSHSNSSELRSEEHTSELQSRFDLVCRLLLEKKKKPV